MVSHHLRACQRQESGFTLVELIIVIILTGILAVAAIPRFFDRTFDERGFHDAVKAAVQHARRVAVASRRFVCVTTTAGTGASAVVSISIDTTLPEAAAGNVSCTTSVPLAAPGRGCAASNEVCAPAGVTLGGDSIIFDPLGRSVTAARAVAGVLGITVSNSPNIAIQPDTGWVQ